MANYRIHQMNRRLGETLDRLAWFGGSAPSGIAALDAERPAPLRFIRLEGYRRSLTVQEVFDRIRQSAALFLPRLPGTAARRLSRFLQKPCRWCG